MGHVRNYTIGDVLTRYHRMRGYNVLQPMGWDAFGLPAENAAMQNKVPPAKWTYDNIAYMKKQLQSLGFAIDWDRELATCQPEYYRWNQWLFLRMLEKGIAYKKTAGGELGPGRPDRAGQRAGDRRPRLAHRRAGREARDPRLLPRASPSTPTNCWPRSTRCRAGRSGSRPCRPTGSARATACASPSPMNWMASRTSCGCSPPAPTPSWASPSVAVAAEHPLATRAAQSNPQLAAFVDECKHGSVMEADMATMEKKGMPTGIFVAHPLTGEQGRSLGRQLRADGLRRRRGDGACRRTTSATSPSPRNTACRSSRSSTCPARRIRSTRWQEWYADKQNGVCVNSGKYDGLGLRSRPSMPSPPTSQAKDLGDKQVQFRLRDWGISRQRYWGCPIPIIHCDSLRHGAGAGRPACRWCCPRTACRTVPAIRCNKRADFLNCACPQCGKPARRETDTMDTFVDSSWYYARYACR